MDRREIVATTAEDDDDADLVLDLGATHPSAPGGLRLALAVDGDRVERAEPLVGALHRGAEKLFEVRDYRAAVVLANRHDWLSSFASELGVVLAAERLAGMEVPVRAVWARTLLAEVTRVLASLAFLGSLPAGGASPGPAGVRAAAAAHAGREALQEAVEVASGGRVHLMLNRVGGLARPLPEGWTGLLAGALAVVRAGLADLRAGVEAFAQTGRGVGVLTREAAVAFAASGPVARASGLDLDLRRDDPYLAYAGLDVPVVVRTAGDAAARAEVLCEQLPGSLDLAAACAARLDALGPGGESDWAVRLPKVLRVPAGAAYCWTEGPLGICGAYLESRGGPTPWRLKLRTPSFAHVQALAAVLPGCRLGDLVPVLASFFYVVGDVDR